MQPTTFHSFHFFSPLFYKMQLYGENRPTVFSFYKSLAVYNILFHHLKIPKNAIAFFRDRHMVAARVVFHWSTRIRQRSSSRNACPRTCAKREDTVLPLLHQASLGRAFLGVFAFSGGNLSDIQSQLNANRSIPQTNTQTIEEGVRHGKSCIISEE